MTEQEIRDLELTYTESKIQHICVCWFRKTFPEVGDSPCLTVAGEALRLPLLASMKGK